METLELLIKIISFLACILLLIGLWRPWVVLWWMPYQNRLMVIKYYGSIGLVSGLLYVVLN